MLPALAKIVCHDDERWAREPKAFSDVLASFDGFGTPLLQLITPADMHEKRVWLGLGEIEPAQINPCIARIRDHDMPEDFVVLIEIEFVRVLCEIITDSKTAASRYVWRLLPGSQEFCKRIK